MRTQFALRIVFNLNHYWGGFLFRRWSCEVRPVDPKLRIHFPLNCGNRNNFEAHTRPQQTFDCRTNRRDLTGGRFADRHNMQLESVDRLLHYLEVPYPVSRAVGVACNVLRMHKTAVWK